MEIMLTDVRVERVYEVRGKIECFFTPVHKPVQNGCDLLVDIVRRPKRSAQQQIRD